MALNRNIALIDLDRRHIETVPVSVDDRDRFLGGGGLATYLLCRNTPKKDRPHSAESVCVISAGLLGGTLSAPRGHTILTTQSVSTGLMTRSCLKGPFAAEMRQAGFDHLVFKGRAKRPACLFVHDGQAKLLEAPDIAENLPIERRKMLLDATAGRETRLLTIKNEGEDRLFLADDSFSPDVESNGSGAGAALAGKNIEAVACRGTLDIEVKDPEAVIAYERDHLARNSGKSRPRRDPEGAAISGPAGNVALMEIEKTVAQCLGLPFETNGDTAASDLGIMSARIRLNTGMHLNENDLIDIAYRCITLERIYNIRAGIADTKGRTAARYRENGWTRNAVMKKRAVFDVLRIGDLWAPLKA